MAARPATPAPPPAKVDSILRRNLIFVCGKGGVGKTSVSQAIARRFSEQGARTLWVTFEDPTQPLGELKRAAPNLWHLNCDATLAFEEYASLKLGANRLTQLFLKNKLVRYLAKAAPGIHELVLLGKLWFDRLKYDYVVCDMPSTGYGLAMFQSTMNFARLFQGGPIHKDAEAMLATFHDPAQCGHLIVALPEEMPLQESLELNGFLLSLFPGNSPAFLVNRRFPVTTSEAELPASWSNPLADSALDYARKRAILENHNLRLWRENAIPYVELEYVPPSREIVGSLVAQLERALSPAPARLQTGAL